jgi:hypothetical protein
LPDAAGTSATNARDVAQCSGCRGGVTPRVRPAATTAAKAFSSEVETGSRQENASKQESRAPFRFNRNGKSSSVRASRRGCVPAAAPAENR